MSKRMGFVINTKRCIGCRTCTVACKMENNVSLGVSRIRVLNAKNTMVFDKPVGKYPYTNESWVTVPCQHCKNAPCVKVCPTGASQKREDGVVFIDKDKCIGCRYCVWSCPYGARQFDEENKVVDKCTMCMHRTDEGKIPMCVNVCMGRAITYGDLNDPTSEVYQLVHSKPVRILKPEQGTEPSVFYF